MASHPPAVRRYVPPAEEETAAWRADVERRHAELEAKRAAGEPTRRTAIMEGPELRDVDAAVQCRCSCHPQPANIDLHDGGATCGCQRTPEDRRAAWAELSAELDEEGWSEWESRESAELAAEADVLSVSARIEVWAAPFVIAGSCDGRGFYLRERHGSYRVTIAGNDDPSSDPWRAEPTETTIDVAAGDEAELRDNDGVESAAVSLRVAVAAVRTALARDKCSHAVVTKGPYCPTCGVLLADAGQWQLPDPV